jgi:DNA-binding NtrC family response regulator
MDDEKYIRDFAAELLSSVGYQVITTIDGTEAIELYKEARASGKPYDAVILDIVVPGGMGGKKAIQQLLEIDPHVKAIVSSGYSSDPMMADFRKYGFKGVIAKPYRAKEMSEILNQVMIGN